MRNREKQTLKVIPKGNSDWIHKPDDNTKIIKLSTWLNLFLTIKLQLIELTRACRWVQGSKLTAGRRKHTSGTPDFYVRQVFTSDGDGDGQVQDFRENFDSWWVPDPIPDKLVLEVGGLHTSLCSRLLHPSRPKSKAF